MIQLPALRTNRVSKEISSHKIDPVTTTEGEKLFKNPMSRKSHGDTMMMGRHGTGPRKSLELLAASGHGTT